MSICCLLHITIVSYACQWLIRVFWLWGNAYTFELFSNGTRCRGDALWILAAKVTHTNVAQSSHVPVSMTGQPTTSVPSIWLTVPAHLFHKNFGKPDLFLPALTFAACRRSVKVMNAVTGESISHLFVFHLVDHFCISMVGAHKCEQNWATSGYFKWCPFHNPKRNGWVLHSHKWGVFCFFALPVQAPPIFLSWAQPSDWRYLGFNQNALSIRYPRSHTVKGLGKHHKPDPRLKENDKGKIPISKSPGLKFTLGSSHQFYGASQVFLARPSANRRQFSSSVLGMRRVTREWETE